MKTDVEVFLIWQAFGRGQFRAVPGLQCGHINDRTGIKSRRDGYFSASMGVSVEKIAEAAKVSLETVRKWLSGNVSVAK